MRNSIAPASDAPRQAALTLLAGPGSVLDLGTTLAGQVVLSGRTVLYVDGANAFDPYLLSRLAREAGQPPRAAMQRLRLSRAFTCHQLETLLAERLPVAIAHFHPGLVVISGWSHLFHDENVPAREAFRLLQTSARRVRALAGAGQPVLATHPAEPATPRLAALEAILVAAADTVLRLREEAGRVLAVCEKPEPSGGPRPAELVGESDLLRVAGYRHHVLSAAYPRSGR